MIHLTRHELMETLINLELVHFTSTEYDDMAVVTIKDEGCYWGSMDDPYGEVPHTYYQTVIFLAQYGAFREAQVHYKGTIAELNDKINNFKLLQ